MGYYIQTPGSNKGKAHIIAGQHGGLVISQEEARLSMADPTKGVIVVVDNGMFEAAGFAFSLHEFEAFTLPDDPRRKQFVVLPRQAAEELSGYAKRSEESLNPTKE